MLVLGFAGGLRGGRSHVGSGARCLRARHRAPEALAVLRLEWGRRRRGERDTGLSAWGCSTWNIGRAKGLFVEDKECSTWNSEEQERDGEVAGVRSRRLEERRDKERFPHRSG